MSGENCADILYKITDLYNTNSELIRKILLGFSGGFGGYLWKVGFFEKLNLIQIKWREGLLYSIMGMIGGLCILNPGTPLNAFAAGLIGIITIKNFINQHSKEDSSPDVDIKSTAMDHDGIKDLYSKKDND